MRKFKAESQKLLDLMIHSVYTNKEIFLRELISNASDALDKRYYLSLSEENLSLDGEDLGIRITPNLEERTLIISDNGCGMSDKDLENNLGVIAKSGSQDFKQANVSENIDIIGQFGVGFYSAFMVAEQVTVISRPMQGEAAWQWHSNGAEGYTITPAEKDQIGTDIILQLREDTENDRFSEFLEEWRLAQLVKNYSDYIRYPIRMLRHKSRPLPRPENAGEDYTPEYENYTEDEILNSMAPLWKRNQSEITAEEYEEFYKNRFHDFNPPAKTIFSRAEGRVSYTALLFIPSQAPWDYYSRDFQKGLALYASGVLIQEKCADLLPDYFSFVRGIVDSEDVSLNISREMLQQDHQMKKIAASLEKKIKSELLTMLKNQREQYESFFREFGRQLKFGAYSDFGAHRELLADLLLFWSAKEQKFCTLEEYAAAMQPEQKYIYFAAGDEVQRLAKLPASQLVLNKGLDVLLCSEDVDEFVLQMIGVYQDKEFKNVNSGDLELANAEEKQAAAALAEQNKDLLAAIEKSLNGKVTKVAASTLLTDHAASLSAQGPVSLEMEKVLSKMPGAGAVKSQQVLELNANHPVFAALCQAWQDKDEDKLARYSELLYNQARLVEGLPLEDPQRFAALICQLMQ